MAAGHSQEDSEPSLLQAKQSQLSQCLSYDSRPSAQVPSSLQRSLLDLVQYVHVSLLLRSPDVDRPLQICSSQGFAVEKTHSTFLDLVVTLSLVQPGFSWLPILQGHFVGPSSTRCLPGPLLESSFPAKHHPACIGEYLGFLPPQGQDLALPLLGFKRVLLAKISSLLTFQGMAAQPSSTSGVPTIHPFFSHLQI